MRVDVWEIRPGVGHDCSWVPFGMEESWGLRELVEEATDNVIDDCGVTPFTLQVIEVDLAELLDLDCGDDYAVSLHAEEFIDQYGEEACREADARRPSGDRHWPATPEPGKGE